MSTRRCEATLIRSKTGAERSSPLLARGRTAAPLDPIVVPPPDATGSSPDWAKLTQYGLVAIIAVASASVLYKGLQIVEDFTSNARKG